LNVMFRRLMSLTEPNKMLTDMATMMEEKLSLDQENLNIREIHFKVRNKMLGES
jgi:hypothetical protein